MSEQVPNGTFQIDIREEIRKYNASSEPNLPPPVIVVDLMCLVRPFIRLDTAGLICGGRFNEMSRHMDAFFGELKSLGVELNFFCDGPVRTISPDKWCEKRDLYYRKMVKLFDGVDNGQELGTLQGFGDRPFHYVCTLKESAMKHGQFHWAIARECDQEMAAFANKSQALAIMTDDSDMLIYEGPWRFWCVGKLNVKNFTLIEYDRVALRAFLGLSPAQMPLLATLVGNDLVDTDALRNFHRRIGRLENITNVANFIRNRKKQTDESILMAALEFCSNRRALMDRFEESMDCYQLNFQPFNRKDMHDPIEAILLSRNVALFYQMWHSNNIECNAGMIDLREEQLGQEVHRLIIALILRMGGIILYQRQMERRINDYSKCNIMIKLQHKGNHSVHQYNVEFPTQVKPPPLEELLSKDPDIWQQLLDTKHELVCWIVSDNLDHHRMKTIPRPLQITALTLYYLVDRHILKVFEADLLLRLAHDVTFSKYDPETLAYPRTLASRPFRVAFVFQKVYGFVAKAFNLVGLIDSLEEDPPFDGVLFHNWYAEWENRPRDDAEGMDEIKEFRIYSAVAAETEEPLLDA